MKRFFIPLFDIMIYWDFSETAPEYIEAEKAEKTQKNILKQLFDYVAAGAAAEIRLEKRFYILSRNIRGQGVTLSHFVGDDTEAYPTSHHDSETAEDFIHEAEISFIPHDHRGQMIIEATTI